MRNRVRIFSVLLFAVLDIVSSFALGNRLDQDQTPSSAPIAYFLPFSLTFAIWGIIFSSALVYAVYQALPAQHDRVLHKRIGGWIALNAALTALWNVTAGQAGNQGTTDFRPVLVVLTVVILAGMLFSLTRVFIIFREMDAEITRRDRWLVQIPVTIFFAWLNVAAIANTTAALLALNFTGEPNGALWAVAMLIVATVLATLMILYSRPTAGTIAYSSVIVWAVIGILINNSSRSMPIVITSILSSIIVIVVTIYHMRRSDPEQRLQPRVLGRAS